MLVGLALIPAFLLLLFVYKRDKKDKEPKKLLVGLFFAGMGTTVSATILELIGESCLDNYFYGSEVTRQLIFAFLIVAPAEELGKYLVTRWITWKNKYFDYSYDGIVYAVFASLGFAAFENVLYVIGNGVITAVVRMLSAVPGHMCFGVLMGYFYSKAKYAHVMKEKGKCFLFKALALIVPIVGHGIYDALLMVSGVIYDDDMTILYVVIWIIYIIGLFVTCFIVVIRASKYDYLIVQIEDTESNQGVISVAVRPNVAGSWRCTCGKENNMNFCTQCGKTRPVNTKWFCPQCGYVSYWKFCGNCGTARPAWVGMNQPRVPVQNQQPMYQTTGYQAPMYQQPQQTPYQQQNQYMGPNNYNNNNQ